MRPLRVAGVDGCRGGWFAAWGDAGAEGVRVVGWGVVAALAEVVDAEGRAPVAVAVDVPIGLAERAEAGGRPADRAARAMLGPRRASVFPAPVRGVLACGSYAEAVRVSRGPSGAGRAPTIQCWNIMPKIREADDLLRSRPDLVRVVHEAHPEVSFAAMAGAPMRHAKRTREGRSERAACLRDAGLDGVERALDAPADPGAARDDALDALALLWTAGRIARGAAVALGGEPDVLGLPMRIVY